MILSGWILPDGYEIFCESYNGSKAHIEIVRQYIQNIYFRDLDTYDTLLNKRHKLSICSNLDQLDDFAVYVLGWIKVNDLPYRYLYYPLQNDFQELIDSYENIGYSLVPVDCGPHLFHIPNPSNFW